MKREGGFTLLELLVVIAILAVLFGVTALALSGVGDDAESAAAAGERDVVQTAIDVCMALDTCTDPGAQAAFTDVGPGGSDAFSAYLRRSSRFEYQWDGTGKITAQQSTDGSFTWP
jgi:prepilin-type N-terminal cleavage/methylation domain-containing protein